MPAVGPASSPRPPALELVKECWSFVLTDDATSLVTTDATITGDRRRFRHLFENLFGTTTEHGDKNEAVRVGGPNDEDGIYVEDDGLGIPEEDRHQAFDDGYSTGESGTSYGLTSVRQTVEARGWELRVIDSAEGGARFEITGVESANY